MVVNNLFWTRVGSNRLNLPCPLDCIYYFFFIKTTETSFFPFPTNLSISDLTNPTLDLSIGSKTLIST